MGSAVLGGKSIDGKKNAKTRTDYEKFKNEDNDFEDEEEKAENLSSKQSRCQIPDGFKFIVIGCILFGLSLTIGVVIDTFTKKQHTGHGGVASDSRLCSIIGEQTLQAGGTAVDAAISSMICLAAVKFGSTSLASGGYMLLHTPKGRDVTIDFQFVAPNSASKDMFQSDKSKSQKGALSVAVPGMLKGLAMAHKKYGKLAWTSLINPTIKLCKEGFPVDRDTVDAIGKSMAGFSSEMKKLITPGGKAPKVDQAIKFRNLSKLLEAISTKGVDAFYTGKFADEIVTLVKVNGGNLTHKDLENYQAKETRTYFTEFGDYKVISTPAPSSGVTALAAVSLFNQLKLSASDQFSTLNYHYLVEVFKFAFAERTLLGDPDFDKNMTEIVKEMLSTKKAIELSKKISKNQTHPPSYYGPFLSNVKTEGTANVVVLGTNGDLVSVVSTTGSDFGSKLMTESGVILNNGMNSFSSTTANHIEAGKRPLSPAAPVIAFHKKKPCSDQYVLGSTGGDKSITATIQVLIDLLNYHASTNEAVRKPRVHNQLKPDICLAEGERFNRAGLSAVLSELKSMGHKMDVNAKMLGAVNVISQRSKDIVAISDDRRSGGSVKF